LSGAGFQGDPGTQENPHYVWVDQHNILGLGANVPFETGNQSDSLHALVDGHFVELRVPYPMGFFTKGLEGRVDDPGAGWKEHAYGRARATARRSTSRASTRRPPARPARRRRHCRARLSSSSSSAPIRSRISAVFDVHRAGALKWQTHRPLRRRAVLVRGAVC
jgi:hypothetical protein